MRASKLLHRILNIHANYENLGPNVFKINEKCYFSSISWPILILFLYLIGLGAGFKSSTQNFATFSVIMQIYANWIQSQWKMLLISMSFLGSILIQCLFYLIGLGTGFRNFYTEFWTFIESMQIYHANLFKINEKCYFSCSISLADYWFCLFYLIGLWCRLQQLLHRILKFTLIYANVHVKLYSKSMFWNATSICQSLGRFWFCLALSDRAWCGHSWNFYTEFWNSLIMQIYANLFKINEKCSLLCHFLAHFDSDMVYLIGLGAGCQNFYTEFWQFINHSNLCKFIQSS